MPLYRTLLFAPANDLKKAGKAFILDADGVVLDLEDAVAVSEKSRARTALNEALDIPRKVDVFVRVNGARTNFIMADLLAAVVEGVKGIVLAKSESAEEVRRVDWLIGQIEHERGVSPGSIELVPFIESAGAVLNAYHIASASPRVSRLFFGGVDFVLDIGTNFSKGSSELFFARSHLVLASRAAGIDPPVDTVYPYFKDIAGLVEDAKAVKQLGFQGKLAIHPAQIGPLNDVFRPTGEELAWARKLVAAFEESEARGQAVLQVEGRMVEYPIASRARQLLAMVDKAVKRP